MTSYCKHLCEHCSGGSGKGVRGVANPCWNPIFFSIQLQLNHPPNPHSHTLLYVPPPVGAEPRSAPALVFLMCTTPILGSVVTGERTLNTQLVNGIEKTIWGDLKWSCNRYISKYSYQSILSFDMFSAHMHEKLFLYVWSYRLGWVEISTWRRWAGLAYKSATGDPPFAIWSPVNFNEGSLDGNSKHCLKYQFFYFSE